MYEGSMELLWELATKTLNCKRKDVSSGWKLKPGITVAVAPEALCPHCKQFVPTNRIWFIDERDYNLRGCWEIKPGVVTEMTSYEDTHPHITGPTGGICMGNGNKTAFDAMFMGISPGSHYGNSERWFWNRGHNCPGLLDRQPCVICGLNHPKEVSYRYGYPDMRTCSYSCYQIAVYFRCYQCGCETGWTGSERWQGRCETCFERAAFVCIECNEKFLGNYMSRVYGTEGSGRMCRTCSRGNLITYCGGCERLYRTEDLIRRYCRNCRPEYFHAPRDPEVEAFEEDEGNLLFQCGGCDRPVRVENSYCGRCCCSVCVEARGNRVPIPDVDAEDEPEDVRPTCLRCECIIDEGDYCERCESAIEGEREEDREDEEYDGGEYD